jgi:hypothetical protein
MRWLEEGDVGLLLTSLLSVAIVLALIFECGVYPCGKISHGP